MAPIHSVVTKVFLFYPSKRSFHNVFKFVQSKYTTSAFVTKKTINAHMKEKIIQINKCLKMELGKIQNSTHWDELRQKFINREIKALDTYVTENNVDSVIMRLCKDFKLFNTGQSFYEYLNKKESQLSDGVLSQYLHLCAQNRQFAIEHESDLIEIYKKLTNKTVIEPQVAERCIATVCLFENRWKDAFNLLEQTKFMSEPTPSSYSAIIEACFKFGEIEKGWQLLRYLAAQPLVKPNAQCYISYIDYCQRTTSLVTETVLDNLFIFLEEYHLNLPNLEVVDKLEKFIFASSDDKFTWSIKETYIPKSGVCSNCRRVLEPAQISSEEFKELCKSFADKVIIGSNVFLKSTPDEIRRFKRFIEQSHSSDMVIDGLNVAYATGAKSAQQKSKVVRSVVDHFLRKQKKVVILGRAYMRTWPDMPYFKQHCNVFLATDLSQDDPLLLYAALRGGEKTCFISRDLMRGHLFLLDDTRVRRLFRKWLASHQYFLGYFSRTGIPSIVPPLPYQPTAQKLPLTTGELCWHVPYEEEFMVVSPDKREPPPKWLCIRRLPR